MKKIHGLLVAHSEKVALAVLALKGAAEAWQRGEPEQLRRHVRELASLEKEADTLRRRVVRDLARSKLALARRDLFRRLVHLTDDVADTAKSAGRFLLIIQDLLLDPGLKSDILKMASLNGAAMAQLAEAIANVDEPPERRLEHVARISELEESVDDLEFKVQMEASGLQVDTWSAIMLWRLVLTMSRVADNIEDAADELLSYGGET